MMPEPVNPTVDRIFRREVWAMNWIGHHLTTLPESALLWTAAAKGRNLGETFAHMIERQFACIERITGAAAPSVTPPRSASTLEAARALAETAGEQLRMLAISNSERTLSETTSEGLFTYPSSVLVAATLDHSMRHREELLAILVANHGLGDLPEFDHETLAFEEWL